MVDKVQEVAVKIKIINSPTYLDDSSRLNPPDPEDDPELCSLIRD